VVRHAFHKVHSGHGKRNHYPNGALLDVVVPAAPGSFRVMLEAADLPDLFGASGLEAAFSKVDALFEASGNPDETVALARDNRGHLASSYLKLLRFLAESQTGLRYCWAAPNSEQPTKQAILDRETGPLVDALSRVKRLGTEEKTLEGRFERFNRNTGSWGLTTKDGSFSGKLGSEDISLDGLAVGGSYRFHCDEEIEETTPSGQEKRTLYLKRHEQV